MIKEGTRCKAICPVHGKPCIVVQGPRLDIAMFKTQTMEEHIEEDMHACMFKFEGKMLFHSFGKGKVQYDAKFIDTLNDRLCLRCGHQWRPRYDDKAKSCPKCNSPYWDRPRKEKKHA